MIKVFVAPKCNLCEPIKEQLDTGAVTPPYGYYDVSTPEGMAEAAMYGVMGTPTVISSNGVKHFGQEAVDIISQMASRSAPPLSESS